MQVCWPAKNIISEISVVVCDVMTGWAPAQSKHMHHRGILDRKFFKVVSHNNIIMPVGGPHRYRGPNIYLCWNTVHGMLEEGKAIIPQFSRGDGPLFYPPPPPPPHTYGTHDMWAPLTQRAPI